MLGVSTWYPDNPIGAGVIQPLRTAVTENRICVANEAPGFTNFVGRVRVTIAADCTELVLVNAAKRLSGAFPYDENIGNNFDIVKMSLEKDGGSWAPVYYGGSRTITIVDGTFDIPSDALASSSFSIPKFTRGDYYWLRFELTVPTTAGTLPFSMRNKTITGTEFWWYNPANTTITNGADGTGPLTASGTAPLARGAGYAPMVMGRFTTSGIRSFVGDGDSIHAGTGDSVSTQPQNGFGTFQRIMTAGDGVSDPWPGINLNRVGAGADAFASAWIKSHYKYADTLIDELGTNDIGQSGNPAAPIMLKLAARWAEFKAINPTGKIVRTYLLPRVSSVDLYATVVGQTPNSGWALGESSNQLNDWFDAKKLDGTIDAVVGRSVLNDVTDPYKWAVNGTNNWNTPDGTHPTNRGHQLRANEVRAVCAAL